MKFIATKELGRLVKWLRILGYDTRYFTEVKTASLVIEALRDNRIILTRKLKMPDIYGTKILYIKSDHLKEQIRQVLQELKLKPDQERMFNRCTVCNAQLIPIQKEEAEGKVPEYVLETQEDFVTCPQCKRIYWQGTHWGNVKEILDEIIC